MSNRVVLTMDTFNKIVDYLQHRPFNEVSGIIDEIRNTAAMVEDNKVQDAPEEPVEENADE